MKKEIVVILLIFLALFGCSKSPSDQLIYENAVFAVESSDGSLQVLENKTYERETVVYLALTNVKGFQKDTDGLNKFDINVEISKDGNVIVSNGNLLGEKGKLNLENNIAKSPYGTFTSDNTLEAGTYSFKITIKDLVIGKEVTTVENFELI